MNPGISIITACYNAAPYIEATLRSVLDQEYDNLEYIVIDGGSTDGTQEIIERYKHRLACYVSEPDGGQYEAIQKGLNMATGEVMAWINADDIYMPWTLSVVGEIFDKHSQVEWITGLPGFLNKKGQITAVYAALACYPQAHIANGWYDRLHGGFLQQESMFWRRSLWEKTGGLDLSLRLAADFKLWTQCARHTPLVPVSVPLAAFRKLPGEQRSSLGSDRYDAEVAYVQKTLPRPPILWRGVAKSGVVARSLARWLIRKRGLAILYNDASQSWRIINSRRPIARLSLMDLQQQHALNRIEKDLSHDS